MGHNSRFNRKINNFYGFSAYFSTLFSDFGDLGSKKYLKGGIFMNQLANLFKNYQNELQAIDAELGKLPTGYLIKRATTYYHDDKLQRVGITKNLELLKQLCRKRYLLKRKAQIDDALKGKIDARTPNELIADFPKAYQSVPISYFYHPSVEKWLAKVPRKNTLNPENEIYRYNDVKYRSMSERIIAEILDKNGLPFQHDATFNLGHAQVSPDFVTKNPFTGKTFIIEFFGAFNQTGYADKMNDKFDAYEQIGFVEGDNLINLFAYHIRDPQRIQKLIDEMIW